MKFKNVIGALAVVSLFVVCSLAVVVPVSDAETQTTEAPKIVFTVSESNDVSIYCMWQQGRVGHSVNLIDSGTATPGATISLKTTYDVYNDETGSPDNCKYAGWEIDGVYYECPYNPTMNFTIPSSWNDGSTHMAEFSNGVSEGGEGVDPVTVAIVGITALVVIGCVGALFYTRP